MKLVAESDQNHGRKNQHRSLQGGSPESAEECEGEQDRSNREDARVNDLVRLRKRKWLDVVGGNGGENKERDAPHREGQPEEGIEWIRSEEREVVARCLL
jgi:hypothetical protein